MGLTIISPGGGDGGKLELLKANSGTSTSAAAADVDTIALTGLTAKDTLVVLATVALVTQGCGAVYVRNSTDAVNLLILEPTLIGAGGGRLIDGFIRQAQAGVTTVDSFGIANANSNVTVYATGRTGTFTTNWTGAWTLALRHDGVTAGGTLQWSWAVYKLKGQ